jgi:uncharacterized membrane protein YczE
MFLYSVTLDFKDSVGRLGKFIQSRIVAVFVQTICYRVSLCPVMAAVIVQMTICYRVSLCPVMAAVFVQTICYRVSLCPVMAAVFVQTICYRVSLTKTAAITGHRLTL